MHRIIKRVLPILLALAPIACSSSGGGGDSAATAASFAGTWDLVAVRAPTSCDPNPNQTLEATVTITTTATEATISGGPFNVTLPLVNGRIQGYSAFNLTTYDWGLTGPNTFAGTQVSGTVGSCDVIFEIVGTRVVSSPTPAAQTWQGSWDLIATQTQTTCVPDPQFGSQTASFDITVAGDTAILDLGPFNVEIPIVNGRIQGYSAFNLTTYDLELTGTDSFVGTQVSEVVNGCTVTFAVTGTRANP